MHALDASVELYEIEEGVHVVKGGVHVVKGGVHVSRPLFFFFLQFIPDVILPDLKHLHNPAAVFALHTDNVPNSTTESNPFHTTVLSSSSKKAVFTSTLTRHP